ncbi:TonB-dependent receptor [Parashewanella spongiae]|uniref:TonB-dependent receptor n=1 Tax=Parashewanella spongiae TaxID=342950 RepID=A0A3A6TLH0_9GAMM|nr:TonB-dependent receptor plug domain-containing protein [Parashewanella spongiae]MCL1078795.1 TonB-dependent receptor [Parashewanella spongiae]RJY11951.1 TonB-dependent receptor [Parashewanella spongiae]
MIPFRISLLAAACASTFIASPLYAAEKDVSAEKNKIERITVYGRQNQVVMDSGLATKSNMSLMETPAAVVIVDKELIEAQGITSLQDVLNNISGVIQAGNNYGIGDNIVVRGLGANYTFDGMYGGAGLGNTFNPTRSLTNIESVEVLKGPATGLYGMGSAGGVINLIEKKPQFESRHELTTEIGQWDSYSLAFDSTAGITDKLAYRVVGKSAQSDGYRGLGSDRDEIYGSLKYLVTDSQDVMFSVAYINDALAVDSIGDPIRIYNEASTGKPAEEATWEDLVNDPNGLGLQLTDEQRKQLADSLASGDGVTPFDLNGQGLISPLSKDNQGEELRFKLTHNIYFTDNLFLNQQLQYRDYTSGFTRQTGAYNYVYWNRKGVVNANPRAPLVEDGVLYPFAARRQEYRKVDADESSMQYFADLRYDFQIDGINNEILVNANYEDRDIDFQRYSIYDADKTINDKDGNQIYQGQLSYIYDIRNPNWDHGNFEDYDPLLTSNYKKSVSAWGVGIQHVGYFGEYFTSRIGVAFNEIKQTYQHLGVDERYRASAAAPTPEEDSKDKGITYNLGVTYRPFENMSVFINHSKGRTAYSILGAIKASDQEREDSESVSNDLGFRYKAFDDQLLASLVVFESARTNIAYTNPEYRDNPDAPGIPQFLYDGEEKTKGVELDVNAQLDDQWMVNINGLYQDARDQDDELKKGIPFVTASAWVTHTNDWFNLSNPMNISLGAQYVDKRTAGSSSFGIPYGYVPAYTIMNAAFSYKAEAWKVQLNVNNLLNKDYYSKAMFLGGTPGEERNVKLTLNYAL